MITRLTLKNLVSFTDLSIDFSPGSLVTLEDSELLPNFSDEIAKKLPPMGKAVYRWKRQLADNCQSVQHRAVECEFPEMARSSRPA